jgi:hypothetical protein
LVIRPGLTFVAVAEYGRASKWITDTKRNFWRSA